MEVFEIEGGKNLCGSVRIESAKNAVLPLLCASLLTDEKCVIKNCPNITDIHVLVGIIKSLGKSVIWSKKDIIISGKLRSEELPIEDSKKLRSSIFLLGALLGKNGRVVFTYPGGCDIGKRPIDLHIKSLKQMGVDFYETGDIIIAEGKYKKSTKIVLDFPSVGVTENLIMASALTKGKTIIKNCAREPEIVDLINYINKMGGKICGGGTNTIEIEGVKELRGIDYTPIPDRIETGTFLIANALCGGEITLSNTKAENIWPLLDKFCDNTCKIYIKDDIIHMKSKVNRKPFYIETAPYPMFATDLQPQMTVLASVANGTSVIKEGVFPNRFSYSSDLIKMGANIKVGDGISTIYGVRKLYGKNIIAKDLRGGAALVLAGLVAEGATIVEGVSNIDRGYDSLEKKLTLLGAKIVRKEV